MGDERVVCDGRGDTRARRYAERCGTRTGLYQERVAVSVIAAGKLDNPMAPGCCPCQT